MSKDTKIASTSSSNIRKRGIQKRVVSVPIKDVERFSAPPPDSWAWRKYGQKPIKGSPYPRGYYKCSSSKECPARKQVERNRVNPSMIVVTYSCEHNHPLPASRSNHHRTAAARNATNSVSEDELEEDEEEEEEEEEEKKSPNLFPSKSHEQELISEDNFSNIIEGSQVNLGHEFGWFADFETSTSCTLLESPILTEDDRIPADNETATMFTLREGDESDLFADLGELPECSTVFRRGTVQREAEQPRHGLATTG